MPKKKYFTPEAVKEAKRLARQRWFEANREKSRVYCKAQYYKNQQERIEYARGYRKENPEVIKAYRAANPHRDLKEKYNRSIE